MSFKSVDEVLDFAIKNEEEAVDFYTDLANKMERPVMRKIFMEFAEEEKGHKEKLLDIKSGKLLSSSADEVITLDITDYLVEVDPGSKLDYQGALILAMNKEKSAYKLYTDLADTTDNENLKTSFLMLAQEEAKHKLRFEIEYDENVLKEM